MTRLATERICRTEDGRYVPETDPAAAYLVAAIGQPLPEDYDAPVESEPEPEPEPEKVEPAETPEKVEGEPTPKRTRKG